MAGGQDYSPYLIIGKLSRDFILTEEGEDMLLIRGDAPKGAKFDSFGDHRMAMSEAILAAFAKGESDINDGECVKKSYPTFWEDFSRVGGRYEMER